MRRRDGSDPDEHPELDLVHVIFGGIAVVRCIVFVVILVVFFQRTRGCRDLPARLGASDPAVLVHQVALSRHWLSRGAAEAGVAMAFRALRPRLEAIGAEAVVLELMTKAIADEERHSGICVELASRYAGQSLAPLPPRGGELPDFGTGDEVLECHLIVLGTSCINESIACEWLRASWARASDHEAAEVHRVHLKDEIDHARLGWAHFASRAVTPEMKALLREHWVERMLAANLAEWKKPDEHLPEGLAELGHLSRSESVAAIDFAVRDVIRPGFAHVRL